MMTSHTSHDKTQADTQAAKEAEAKVAEAPTPYKNWGRDTTRPLELKDVEGHLTDMDKRFEAVDARIKALELSLRHKLA
jgi:hypothetical protein